MNSLLSAFDIALVALALTGCGNGITEQDGVMVGGAGQGAGSGGGGGGTVVSGGGSAGRAGGGAGMASMSDAGAEGGSGGEGGSSGGFMYPAGCPVPAPIPAKPNQQIVIQSLNFNTSEIVLKNVSTTPVVIKGTRSGWQWCNFPAYWYLSDDDITLQPGQTFKFLPNYNTSGVRQFEKDSGEVGIYSVSGSFDEPDLILNFVSWGTGILGGREYVATMADVWTYDNHIDVGSGAGFVATGNVKTAAGFTPVPTRCLVAPPNP
jgi:hypothetical protein